MVQIRRRVLQLAYTGRVMGLTISGLFNMERLINSLQRSSSPGKDLSPSLSLTSSMLHSAQWQRVGLIRVSPLLPLREAPESRQGWPGVLPDKKYVITPIRCVCGKVFNNHPLCLHYHLGQIDEDDKRKILHVTSCDISLLSFPEDIHKLLDSEEDHEQDNYDPVAEHAKDDMGHIVPE